MILPDRLFLLCKDVLAAVEDGFATAGVMLPDRRYVANGDQQVAIDCAQVTVAHQTTNSHGGNVALAQLSGQTRDVALTLRAATVAVQIVRCAPTIKGVAPNLVLPTPAEEETSAMEIYADGQIALNSILTAQKAGELTSCNGLVFLDLVTIGSQGGYASSKLRIMLGLE